MSAKKIAIIVIHVLFTIIMIIIPVFLMPLKEEGPVNFVNIPLILFTLSQVAGFYFSAYVLYPRLLGNKRIVAYVLSILLLCLLCAALSAGSSYFLGERSVRILSVQGVIKFFTSLFVMGTATAYSFILDVIKEQYKKQENLSAELSFLRSQVSPHFMFNTLNSMVWLARKKSDQLEPALIELSNLMHYMLYESDQERVSFNKEIDYIQSYIDLQALRFVNQVHISFDAHKTSNERYIEPMLLIPLIENAFKHGIGLIVAPQIRIALKINDNKVCLQVANKFNEHSTETKDNVSGIGLANLTRRLNLLYPDRHELQISKEDNWFTTSLKIELHD